jgi:sugar (pentulose or hexulose) kinase
MVRAVLEGCALHLRSILDQLAEQRAPELVAVGGVTRSVLWRGIIADVTGATLLLPRVVEAGALGAAILAGVGVGIFADVPDAVAKLVRIVGRREADASNHAFYDQLYRVYLELEQRVAPLYGQLPVEG